MSKPQGQTNAAASRKVEVFRPGTFRAMNGHNYSFSEADVANMASGYDAEKAPAPVVVGHPKHDDPAFGWAKGFEINEAGTLVAELGELAPEFVSAVEEGRYRKVSMKFFPPEAPNNPNPGNYYPRHIGFLGGAAPAVSGLDPGGAACPRPSQPVCHGFYKTGRSLTMARFTYHGPVQSIALAVGRTKDKDGNEISKFKDFDFKPGHETPDLPEGNPICVAMIERKLLRLLPSKPPRKPAKSNAADKGEK